MSGRQKRKAPDNRYKALLNAVWNLYGGVGAVSKKIGTPIQAPVNWRNRGKVPLMECLKVANSLKLTSTQEYGLNYIELGHMRGGTLPVWNSVVDSFKFPPSVKRYILSFKE